MRSGWVDLNQEKIMSIKRKNQNKRGCSPRSLSLRELKRRAISANRQLALLYDEIDIREIAHRAPATTRAADEAAKAAGYFRNGEVRNKAEHREIARRYAWETSRKRSRLSRPLPGKTGSSELICIKRMREIEAIITKRHGAVLPRSHTGALTAEIMSHHIAHAPGDAFKHITAWLNVWTPWMTHQEKVELAERVLHRRRKYKAATLGQRLQLTYAERKELRIRTIGACDISGDEQREIYREARRNAAAKKRRKQGAKPRARYVAESLAQTRPWDELGVSRRTWYRHGKPTPAKAVYLVGASGGWEGSSGKNVSSLRLAQVPNSQVDYQLPSDKICHRRASVLPLGERNSAELRPWRDATAEQPSKLLQVDGRDAPELSDFRVRRRRPPPTSLQKDTSTVGDERELTMEQIKRRQRKFFGSPEWHRMEKFMAEGRKRLGIRSVVDEYVWPGDKLSADDQDT
jgi:hypothetical protein